MQQKIVLASGNQGKLREFVALLNEPRLQLLSLRESCPPGFEVEETGSTFEENAWLKACAVCEETQLPALADDSGLEVDALGGQPGVHSARFAGEHGGDAANTALLLQKLRAVPVEERSARFRCVLAFAVPSAAGPVRHVSVSGVLEGRILEAPRGAGGFGYDPVFAPLVFPGQSLAELPAEEKNRISHRGQAVQALRGLLHAWLAERTSG